jgi:hypothetical protein
MAAITSANVVVVKSWEDGDRSSKWTSSVRRLKITLAAQGATIGDIPAAALGFREIYDAYAATLMVANVPKGVIVCVDLLGTELVTVDINQATDATRGDRANVTGVLFVTVRGRAT